MNRDEAERLLRGDREGIKEWNRRCKAGEDIPDLTGVDLAGASLAGAILNGAQLSNANLAGADLRHSDLVGAVLIFANLSKVDLSDSFLSNARLIGADLADATLVGADAQAASLIKANLERANLSNAKLWSADLSQASLAEANLTGADLTDALLDHANLTGAILRSANLERSRVVGVKYRRHRLVCQGVRAESCFGNAVFKRDVQDQDWIETFRTQSRWHYAGYLPWKLFTDCGRSLTRLCVLAACLSTTFGYVYASCPGLLNMDRSANTPFTPYYYSFVTFTTLGYGDVTPATYLGEVITTVEVVLGYLTLGILVSILANKVARRS